MPQAQLYFLSDQYYRDFPDDKLMQNKDIINGTPHSRPCCVQNLSWTRTATPTKKYYFQTIRNKRTRCSYKIIKRKEI